jgi:hypothetical protein
MEHFPLVDRLHTDVLEAKYGPISARLIKHTTKIRMAHLVDTKNISRTFAMTFLTKSKWNRDIRKINRRIMAGEAIGKAFRKFGYSIRKNVLDVYIIDLPEWLQKEFALKVPAAKARISEFYAKREDTEPIIYGEVVEIYSPDFRSPAINEVDKSQISALSKELEKEGFTSNEIWDVITSGNDWSGSIKQFRKARASSLAEIEALKQKIFKTIWRHKK